MSEIISTADLQRVVDTVNNSHARPLRVAQLAPLYESVPPKLYGGTERVVSYLTEELVRRGHEVSLFASGDSQTKARLRAGFPRSLRLAGLTQVAMSGMGYHFPMLSDVFDHADEFDIVHAHLDYWTFPFARQTATPTITTLHGRLDQEEIHSIFRSYEDMPVVSISDNQRKPLPTMNWVSTVYHGLPRDLLPYNPNGGKYLAFLGRIAPEKRPDLAIDVARKAGIPLKIAAKVDVVDREYFRDVIEPKIKGGGVEYIGEINDREKGEFLGNALALLFTIDWPEPFGLVMIEALATGTPVIARPCGSVPEILRDGVTGFFASEVDELVAAVKRVETLSRAQCREEFERRFTVQVMADNYERIYREMMKIWPRRDASNGAVRPAAMMR
jgi:glycosyltransferase involved in cell wall biosynthesis